MCFNIKAIHKNVVFHIHNTHYVDGSTGIAGRSLSRFKCLDIPEEENKKYIVQGSFQRSRRIMLFYILRFISNNIDNCLFHIRAIDKNLIILNAVSIRTNIKSEWIFKIDRASCVD